MARIILSLDDETHALVAQAARCSGLSNSDWIVELIRNHLGLGWSVEILKSAGRFTDFPLREDSPIDQCANNPRHEA